MRGLRPTHRRPYGRPGVSEANVNLVTGIATVSITDGDLPATQARERVAAAIVDAGYGVAAPAPETPESTGPPPRTIRKAGRRAPAGFVIAALTVPLSRSACPGLALRRDDGGRWLQLALAAPVVLGRALGSSVRPGRPRAAAPRTCLRSSRSASAAFLYSTAALLAPVLGRAVTRATGRAPHRFGGGRDHLRAPRQGARSARQRLGDAVRSLVALQPKRAARRRTSVQSRPSRRDLVRVRPEACAGGRRGGHGAAAIDASLLTGERPGGRRGGRPRALRHARRERFGGRARRGGWQGQRARADRRGGEGRQGSKGIARLADTVSGVFVPIVLGVRCSRSRCGRVDTTPAGLAVALRALRRGARHRVPVRSAHDPAPVAVGWAAGRSSACS